MSNTQNTNKNPAIKKTPSWVIYEGPWPARLKAPVLGLMGLCAIVSGCATAGGTVGNRKLEASDLAQLESMATDLAPLLQTAALASGNPEAAKAAGTLSRLSSFKQPQGPSIPAGYSVKWDSFLEGRVIDESKIVRVPKLVPVSETAVLKEQIPQALPSVSTNELGQSLSDAIRGL